MSRNQRSSAPPAKLNEYFIDGQGIHRQVLQTEICKFLGPEATSRPGDFEGRKGFKIRAIRPFTSEMILDLQKMSNEYESETRQYKKRRGEEIAYEDSQTRIKNDPAIDPRDTENYSHGGYGPPQGVYSPYQEPPRGPPQSYMPEQGYNPNYPPGQNYMAQYENVTPSYQMQPPGADIQASDRTFGHHQNYVVTQPNQGSYPQGGYNPPTQQPRGYQPPHGDGRGRGIGDYDMGGMPEVGPPYGQEYRGPQQPYNPPPQQRGPYPPQRRR